MRRSEVNWHSNSCFRETFLLIFSEIAHDGRGIQTSCPLWYHVAMRRVAMSVTRDSDKLPLLTAAVRLPPEAPQYIEFGITTSSPASADTSPVSDFR